MKASGLLSGLFLTGSIAASELLPLQLGDQFPPNPDGYEDVSGRCIGPVDGPICDASVSVLRGDDYYLIVVSHLDHRDNDGVPTYTVADVVSVQVPNHLVVSIGNCRLDQQPDVSIVAIVDYSTSHDGWTDKASWAKQVDMVNLRIQNFDPGRVTCYSETMY